MNNLKKNAAPKSAKKDLYADLPTTMQAKQSDLHPELVAHFKEYDLAFKWLNSKILGANHNVHHAEYQIWIPPSNIVTELSAKGVPFGTDGTVRKGQDLVLGVQKKSLQAERREQIRKKNAMLAGIKETKKKEFKEKIARDGIGHSVDTDYGEE